MTKCMIRVRVKVSSTSTIHLNANLPDRLRATTFLLYFDEFSPSISAAFLCRKRLEYIWNITVPVVLCLPPTLGSPAGPPGRLSQQLAWIQVLSCGRRVALPGFRSGCSRPRVVFELRTSLKGL